MFCKPFFRALYVVQIISCVFESNSVKTWTRTHIPSHPSRSSYSSPSPFSISSATPSLSLSFFLPCGSLRVVSKVARANVSPSQGHCHNFLIAQGKERRHHRKSERDGRAERHLNQFNASGVTLTLSLRSCTLQRASALKRGRRDLLATRPLLRCTQARLHCCIGPKLKVTSAQLVLYHFRERVPG